MKRRLLLVDNKQIIKVFSFLSPFLFQGRKIVNRARSDAVVCSAYSTDNRGLGERNLFWRSPLPHKFYVWISVSSLRIQPRQLVSGAHIHILPIANRTDLSRAMCCSFAGFNSEMNYESFSKQYNYKTISIALPSLGLFEKCAARKGFSCAWRARRFPEKPAALKAGSKRDISSIWFQKAAKHFMAEGKTFFEVVYRYRMFILRNRKRLPLRWNVAPSQM